MPRLTKDTYKILSTEAQQTQKLLTELKKKLKEGTSKGVKNLIDSIDDSLNNVASAFGLETETRISESELVNNLKKDIKRLEREAKKKPKVVEEIKKPVPETVRKVVVKKIVRSKKRIKVGQRPKVLQANMLNRR